VNSACLQGLDDCRREQLIEAKIRDRMTNFVRQQRIEQANSVVKNGGKLAFNFALKDLSTEYLLKYACDHGGYWRVRELLVPDNNLIENIVPSEQLYMEFISMFNDETVVKPGVALLLAYRRWGLAELADKFSEEMPKELLHESV